MNFKERRIGKMIGIFDLIYHGLAVRGCHMMTGSAGYWFSFPQIECNDLNGEKHYFDFLYLTPPEHEHVSNLVKKELQAQGFINEQIQENQRTQKGNGHQMHSSTETGSVPQEDIFDEDFYIPLADIFEEDIDIPF
jgi:hypothetical protein